MPDETPLGDATRRAALDAYARSRGHNTWRDFCGAAGITPATRGLFDTISAAIAPLQQEIQRLTTHPDPATEPTARELVALWERITPAERLNLAARLIHDSHITAPEQLADLTAGPLPESCLVVLRDLAAGYTARQIATRLGVSFSCVNQRVHRAKKHLGLTRYNTARLILEAHRRGLLGPHNQEASSA